MLIRLFWSLAVQKFANIYYSVLQCWTANHGICVHSFARDYLWQQFWSFCFFPHPSRREEQWRYWNLASGLKYLIECCRYLFMNWKYQEISLVLFLQPFQARVFTGWLIWIRNSHHQKSLYCPFHQEGDMRLKTHLSSHSNTELKGLFFFFSESHWCIDLAKL